MRAVILMYICVLLSCDVWGQTRLSGNVCAENGDKLSSVVISIYDVCEDDVADFAVESVYSIANAFAVRTTCGKAVTTVGPEFFKTPEGKVDNEEFRWYMEALNKKFCGEEGMPRVIHN